MNDHCPAYPEQAAEIAVAEIKHQLMVRDAVIVQEGCLLKMANLANPIINEAYAGSALQADLFEADPGDGDLEDVLDALHDRFGDEAIVRSRGFSVKLTRRGPSKAE